MNIDIVVDIIKQRLVNNQPLNIISLNKEYPDVYLEVIKLTNFLDENIQASARYYCIMNNITTHPTCKTCGTNVKWGRLFSKGFKTYCSSRCKNLDPSQQKLARDGLLKKYGVTNPSHIPGVQEKREQTCMDRYGDKYPSTLPKFKQKTIDTNLDRYGVAHIMKLQTTQNKVRQTNLDRYGVEYPQQDEQIRQRSKETQAQKYNRPHHLQQNITTDSLSKLNDKDWLYDQHYTKEKSLTKIAEELNTWDTTVGRYLKNHGLSVQHHFQSTGEKEVVDFVQTLNVTIEQNTRIVIPPFELDIYLPEYNLAIEYCGLYWHSNAHKDNNYHRNKHIKCKEKGIRLLTIFEDEWLTKQNQVKTKIKSILNKDDRERVFARKCNVVDVSASQKLEFFEQYHIQGSGPGSINYGLEYNSELVACMTFIRQKNQYCLNRYATSARVPGGFSKLLKHFQKNNQWNKIISFADLRWSSGELYEKNGWELNSTLPPDYSYIRGNHRIHKFNYRRKNLPKLLEHFNPDLSEKQNCDIHGVLRIYDCGKLRYVITQ